MKKVFTHENRLIVFHIKNILYDEGIECLIKNEFSAGGAGDLAPFDTWPELWVNDSEEGKARDLVELNISKVPSGKEWICTSCGEMNDFNFQICWQCNQADVS